MPIQRASRLRTKAPLKRRSPLSDRRKGSVQPGTCCGKQAFATLETALSALARIDGTSAAPRRPRSAYQCEHGWWLLTSQSGTAPGNVGLRGRSRRRRRTGPDRVTRNLVIDRDRGCVLCGECPFGLQIHHRKPRRMGGRTEPGINAPGNLITLCPGDHDWVESRRDQARDLGLLLHENDDPSQVPVHHYLHGVVQILDDGTVRPVPHLREDTAT